MILLVVLAKTFFFEGWRFRCGLASSVKKKGVSGLVYGTSMDSMAFQLSLCTIFVFCAGVIASTVVEEEESLLRDACADILN
jgi:hypothetical protein